MDNNPDYTNVQDIESGDIEQMVDSSSTELLAEFEKKKKMFRIWPWLTGLLLLIMVFLSFFQVYHSRIINSI